MIHRQIIKLLREFLESHGVFRVNLGSCSSNLGFIVVRIDRRDPKGLAIGSQFDLGLRSDLEQIQDGTIDHNRPAVSMP
jgi:hypothetical protein